MKNLSNVKTPSSLLILLLAAFATVATSKSGSGGNITTYTVLVATTCLPSSLDGQVITAVGSSITQPNSSTFLDTGLPVENLDLSILNISPISSDVFGPNRNCLRTLSEVSGTTQRIYDCTDNGTPICQVIFTPQQ